MAPDWARLAYVEFVATDLWDVTFELSAGDPQFTRFGAGNVQWNKVDLSDIATVMVRPPVKVTGVWMRGTDWSDTFLDYLAAERLGEADDGYGIPVGLSAQLDPLPWTNVNMISIAFDKDVNVTQADLGLSGVNVPAYGFSNFSYDNTDHTATWTLSSAIAKDKLVIDLADTVTDAGGLRLDGEWVDEVSTYPSGDGVAGGDFRFRFNVLPGDADQSGRVFTADAWRVLNHLHAQPGDPDYDPFADMDGSGRLFTADAWAVIHRLHDQLPAGEPVIPPRSQDGHDSLLGRRASVAEPEIEACGVHEVRVDIHQVVPDFPHAPVPVLMRVAIPDPRTAPTPCSSQFLPVNNEPFGRFF